MLLPASSLLGRPVLTGQWPRPVGHVAGWVINPATGKIVAYQLSGGKARRYLVPLDILRLSSEGIVISEPEQVQPLDNLVRVRELTKQPISLTKLPVFSEQQQRLGRVEDFVIDTGGHTVAKLYVQPPLWRRLVTHSLIIPRERIVRITPRHVIVRYDAKAASPVTQPEIAQQ